jgi:hypothetical protein
MKVHHYNTSVYNVTKLCAGAVLVSTIWYILVFHKNICE